MCDKKEVKKPSMNCIKCGSRDINEVNTRRYKSVIYITIHCANCGADYKERYTFTNFEDRK